MLLRSRAEEAALEVPERGRGVAVWRGQGSCLDAQSGLDLPARDGKAPVRQRARFGINIACEGDHQFVDPAGQDAQQLDLDRRETIEAIYDEERPALPDVRSPPREALERQPAQAGPVGPDFVIHRRAGGQPLLIGRIDAGKLD
ncbi:MAG TPA: hypothetical protein VF770_06670, partial [Solirubrobacterales bacterium]